MCQLSLSYTVLNVTISVDYTPAPDEAPEELAANEFTAGSTLNLTCSPTVQGASGSLSYYWSVEGNPDPPSQCIRFRCYPPTSNIDILTFSFLSSYYAGTYTCSVSESGRSGSDSYTIRVVGTLCMECVAIFHLHIVILSHWYRCWHALCLWFSWI